jgi:hypothetical protein
VAVLGWTRDGILLRRSLAATSMAPRMQLAECRWITGGCTLPTSTTDRRSAESLLEISKTEAGGVSHGSPIF